MTKAHSIKSLLWPALGLAALVVTFGCSNKLMQNPVTNQLPTVRLTSAPIDTSGRYYYSYTVDWVGFDPDGRVDHYLYTIDPQTLAPGMDTVWTRTEDNERRLFFQAREPIQEESHRYIGTDFHIFVIKAVDDAGAAGPFSARSFYAYTVAPNIRIQNPTPTDFQSFVTPTVRIRWSGEDPDGVFTTKPVKYKYILLSSSSEFPKDLAIQKPDSLRRYYEHHPLGPWAGWDSTSADTTQVQFTNLTPGTQYVFAVIAFDEAGAYSPQFDFTSNMIKLQVGFAGVLGPQITLFNEFFFYQYTGGGYCVCEKAQIKLEVPGNQPITFNWFADPPEGSDIKSYRWALDIENPFDNTPRTNELTDLAHCSSPSANVTSATVGPYGGAEVHFFYVEAEDNNGLKSLGIVRFTTVVATLEKSLLVVDDTRLRVDIKNSFRDACVQPPSGPWPTAAELDTFLYARGGHVVEGHPESGREMKQWRCYPDGLKPLPGLFSGYEFDTLNTRVGKVILTVPLSVLGHYRHIMWMVDGAAGQQNRAGTDPVSPQSALRYMGLPGNVNTLAAYVKQGGKVWLSGGGASNAVSDGFNDVSNDRPPISQTKTYSHFSSTRNELGPGRFMYDIAKWQSEFRIFKPNVTAGVTNGIQKALGRFRSTSQYAELPPLLEPKTAATDPLNLEAPTRTASNLYITAVDVEFLQIENNIIEDINADADSTEEASTLDTLYRVSSAQLPDRDRNGNDRSLEDLRASPGLVIMTFYHGPPPQNSEILVSGFPIWFFQRQQCQALLDYVLQRMWGIPKGPIPSSGTHARRAAMVTTGSRAPGVGAGVVRREVPLGIKSVAPVTPKYPRD